MHGGTIKHPVPAALAFVTLLFILSCLLPPSDGLAPSHDAPSTPKRWANYLALTQWMGHSLDVADDKGRLWNSAWDDSTSSSLGDEAVCDPHNCPGVMHLAKHFESLEGALETLWRPFNATNGGPDCPTQSYVKQLAEALQAARENGHLNEKGLGRIDQLPQAFKNRTIFLFGDSIDRNNIEFTCSMLQGRRDIILPDTPLWPQSSISSDPKVRGWKPNKYSARSFPTFCHIEEIDLMFVNVFHFGLDEEGYFEWKDQYGPPYTVEERMREIVLPLVGKLQRRIDIFSFGSGLWDLARFGRIDDGQLTADSENTLRHLSVERLAWFSQRYGSTLAAISSSLARSPVVRAQPAAPQLLARILHIPSDDSQDDFQQWWQVPGGGEDGSKHTYYFPSWRIGELNSAIRNAVSQTTTLVAQGDQNSPKLHDPRPSWAIDTWGDKLFGLEIYDKGNVHPHMAATTVWLEMMLFRLINGQ